MMPDFFKLSIILLSNPLMQPNPVVLSVRSVPSTSGIDNHAGNIRLVCKNYIHDNG